MNKTAIKNFAIKARNKLISEISYRAGLMGITASGIKAALPQSGSGVEYYDIGTKEPYAVMGAAMKQRADLVAAIKERQDGGDYKTAYEAIIDETAYTWFNRLIAVRFMEVNDYLPSEIRVLSSLSGKLEPDIVTTPFDALLEYSDAEKAQIVRLKNEEKLDELFRFLFLKQCNALNAVLPALFEKVADYTELLLPLSFTDKDGVVYHLVHDIPEEDFNVEVGGQVEIIGWLYQYYNTEPKAKVFARASGTKIEKDDIPAATQLFTPDWIVRYMVENSLGRLWVEGHENSELKANWNYYLEEAEQEPEVEAQLAKIRAEHAALNPEDIRCIDPCMGSGHILVYLFDVLMQIYESVGYSERDAAQSILQHNLYGLDIDDRAAQLAYFAVMMKARQYDRRILTRGIEPHVYAVQESNEIENATVQYFCAGREELKAALQPVLDAMHDAKEYGSILTVPPVDFAALYARFDEVQDEINFQRDNVLNKLLPVVRSAELLSRQYHVVVTNPPYMSGSSMDSKLTDYIKKHYPDSKTDMFTVFIERCAQLTLEAHYQAMITQHAWMFLSSFEKLRSNLLEKCTINMLHLGARAFEEIGGEVVQTTSFVFLNKHINNYKSIYCRLLEPTTQKGKEELYLSAQQRFVAKQDSFAKIPSSPVAYWVAPNILQTFAKFPTFRKYGNAVEGIKTGDNEKCLRLWFEVSRDRATLSSNDVQNRKWHAMTKGGQYRRWYGNLEYVALWGDDGVLLRNSAGASLPNKELFFSPALNWTYITSGNFAMRVCADYILHNNKGPACYLPHELQYYMLGLMNTKYAQVVMGIIAPTLDCKPGNVNNIPICVDFNKKATVETTVETCVNLSRDDWDSFETSWDYKRNPLIMQIAKNRMLFDNISAISLDECYECWATECEERFHRLKANEEELNRIFIDIYGLQDELTPEVDDKDVTVRKADLTRDIKNLISYAVGCMFGRYSLNEEGLILAGQKFEETYIPATAPVAGMGFAGAPGMYAEVPNEYFLQTKDGGAVKCTFAPDKDNIIPITDEEYMDDDIVGLFCVWLKKVFGPDTLEENLQFIANALGGKGSPRAVIRNYFLNDFYTDHCRKYQKRPIYWLYDSGKQNGFKALVYMHRYDADTTGRVRVDYLHHMEKIYESEIGSMADTIEHSDSNREIAAATKRKEKLRRQLDECRSYDEKIAHLALSRIGIDLDDGVKVNYRKVQTDANGKFYEILANSKDIMGKK